MMTIHKTTRSDLIAVIFMLVFSVEMILQATENF